MLVLSRKTSTKVRLYIGDKLLGEITNLGKCRFGGVSLGFDFVPEIRIERDDMKSDAIPDQRSGDDANGQG